MNQSTPDVQYFVKPPSVPIFLSGRVTYLRRLMQWAKEEHSRWLQMSIRRGYFETVKYLNEEYSPVRLLAEIQGFRRICARITQRDWDNLTGRERVFIRRAFELRELLFS